MPLFCVIGGRLCPYSLVMEVGHAPILCNAGSHVLSFSVMAVGHAPVLCDRGRSCPCSL